MLSRTEDDNSLGASRRRWTPTNRTMRQRSITTIMMATQKVANMVPADYKLAQFGNAHFGRIASPYLPPYMVGSRTLTQSMA